MSAPQLGLFDAPPTASRVAGTKTNRKEGASHAPLRAEIAEPSATTVGGQAIPEGAPVPNQADVAPAADPPAAGGASKPSSHGPDRASQTIGSAQTNPSHAQACSRGLLRPTAHEGGTSATSQSRTSIREGQRIDASGVSGQGRESELDLQGSLGVDDPTSIALEIAENLMVAEGCIAELARELAPASGGDWYTELSTMLERANARAEAELQELRKMHAKILGVSVDELDAQLAAEEAEKRRERAERKQTSHGASARVGHKTARANGIEAQPPQAPNEKSPTVEPTTVGARLPTERLSARQIELVSKLRLDGQLAVFGSGSEDHIDDWAALKIVMTELGAKWRKGSKKAKPGFLFPDDVDALETMRLAIETGEILSYRAAGYFPTPAWVADRVVALADLRPGDNVLEPSAGRGALVDAVLRACPTARVKCVELMPANAEALRAAGHEVVEGDFLAMTNGDAAWLDISPTSHFDVAILNPPFGGGADVRHVRHVLGIDIDATGAGFIKPHGALVAIMSAGVMFRDDALHRRFRDEVKLFDGRLEELPEGSFLESGTGVRTCVCVIPRGGAA